MQHIEIQCAVDQRINIINVAGEVGIFYSVHIENRIVGNKNSCHFNTEGWRNGNPNETILLDADLSAECCPVFILNKGSRKSGGQIIIPELILFKVFKQKIRALFFKRRSYGTLGS